MLNAFGLYQFFVVLNWRRHVWL